MHKLTIYDVSKLAGVSVTTVSRVLNGSASVNAETREKVEEVIRKHSYIPKQKQRNFVQRDLYAVGLMMDDVRNPYMAGLAYAIDQELSKWKVNTVLCNITDVEREFISKVDNLIEKRVNGVILMGSIYENEISRVAIEQRYSGFPFVAVNGNFALPNVHEVIQDQFLGTKEAVKYLHQQGRKRIGWVYYRKSGSDQKKYDGFLEGMQECELPAVRMRETSERSLEAGKRAAEILLKLHPDTDAIICSADILAVGCAHCLNEMGVAIPEEVALIGFNNSSSAQECYPPLTSIDNNLDACGKSAAQLMIRVLNKQEVEHVLIPCGLELRGEHGGKIEHQRKGCACLMKKPNIIFLIQDQMQQRVLRSESGCLMPNLRALMRDSVVFDRAYTCNAICSPSRASLLTGTLPHVHGMVDCTHTVPPYRAQFDDSLDTLTQALHDEDYRVSYYGKWHVERTHNLEKFGVDAYETETDIPGFQVTMKDKVMLTTPGYADRMVCGVFEEGAESTEEHYIYEKALADIEAHKDQGKPFCTFISTYAPHDPYCVPQELYDLYQGADLKLPRSYHDSMEDKPAIYRRMRSALGGLTEDDYRKAMRCYYSYCSLVDLQVGKLTAYLKEKDLYDDTLIVCMSDHGDMMGAHGLMMKSVEAFEEIYHIPLVMKLPNQERAGQTAGFYINTYEVAPTVLELAGCRPLRGEHVAASMVPWLTGEKQDGHYAFAEFFGQRYAYTQRIYWQDNLKYVFNAFDDDELYDLAADPDELTNLSNHPRYQDKKVAMCAGMWERIKETDDDTLLDAEYYLLRIAPVGPGPKKQNGSYSIYNKSF